MHDRRHRAAVTLVLLAPFYLNDLANVAVHDWRWWLAIDYVAVKLLPLALLAWLLATRRLAPAELGLAPQPPVAFAGTAVALAVLATVIDQNGYRLIADLPGYPALGAMPPIESPAMNALDLSVGLLLVAVVEELVFRAYLCHLLERLTGSPIAIVAISATAFGLIHWSGGMHAVLITGAIGALFSTVYLRTRCIAPMVIAHLVVNVVDFAGVIPESWFRFA